MKLQVVTIDTFTSENEDDDVSKLADELERNLITEELISKKEENTIEDESEEVKQIKRQIAEIEQKIKGKRSFLKSATNIIV